MDKSVGVIMVLVLAVLLIYLAINPNTRQAFSYLISNFGRG